MCSIELMFRTGGDCLLISHLFVCCADILYWSAQIWWSVLWWQRFAFVPSGVNLLTKVCTLKTQISSCFSNYNISFLFTQQIYTLTDLCRSVITTGIIQPNIFWRQLSYACGSYGNLFLLQNKKTKNVLWLFSHNSDFSLFFIYSSQFWLWPYS